jgi:signal transduction histidine kinase/CheY-like chemotaxis protein
MTLPGTLKRLERYATPQAGLVCLGLVTGGFIVLCLVVLLQARSDAARAANIQAHNIAAGVAQDVARNIDLYDLSLQAVVRGLQWPHLKALPPELRQAILFQRVAHASYFGFTDVLDANGTVIADSRSAQPRGGNFASRDYFVAQRHDAPGALFPGALFIGAPFLKGPRAMIPLSRRIANADGSFAGVVVGTMQIAYFRDLFTRLDIGPHGSIALLRDDGMVLMRLPYDADIIGRTLPPGAPFFRARQGGVVDTVDSVDHRRRHVVFERVGRLPLVVAVGLADSDIYAAWRRHAVVLGVAITALSLMDIALLLVLCYALRRRGAGLAALRAGEAQRADLLEQRELAVAGMEQAAAANTRFVAAMSHELRTPLSGLLGYAELLALDGGLGPAQAGRLAGIRSAGQHLRGVIDKVLDFSRAEAAAPGATAVAIDLPAVLAECCAMIEPMVAAKGLRLIRAIAPELPRQIIGDAVSIRQALLNLLDNAVKFTAHGAVSVQVSPCRRGIRLTVADTGLGIPPGLRGKLFQPFERLGAERLGVAGTGLGLAITARMVARLGGRIGHDPNPGGGSIFWLELPLHPAEACGPTSAAAAAPVRALRILAADDSSQNLDVIAGFLNHAGHGVARAESGEEAVRLAVAESFDVILMDLRMPGMDGATALRLIRALPGPRGCVPAIAVTAQQVGDGGAALRAAGFQTVLVKPVDRMALLNTVAAAAGATAPGATAANAAGLADPAVLSSVGPFGWRASEAANPWEDARTPEEAGRGAEGADDTAHASDNGADMADDGATCDKHLFSGASVADGDADRAAAGALTDAHLAEFATQIARLLRLLEAPAAPELPDLVHRIQGDAAQLGYAGLTLAAKRFQASLSSAGTPRPEAVAMLRDMAETIAEALAHRHDDGG